LGSDFFKNTLNQVKNWGVSEMTLRALVIEHGEGQVSIGLECTLDALKSNKTMGNAGGFFCKAVEEKWQSNRQSKTLKRNETPNKPKEWERSKPNGNNFWKICKQPAVPMSARKVLRNLQDFVKLLLRTTNYCKLHRKTTHKFVYNTINGYELFKVA
jgi:hypothetical protein